MNNKFDGLAKGLAQSVTRRQALKRFGVGLAGMVLAFGLGSRAEAGSPIYTTIDFPGAVATLAVDINNSGQIVGRYIDASGINHGSLLANGIFTSITCPGAYFTRAIGINGSGDIVGSYFNPNEQGPAEHGFLLRGGVFTSINFPNAAATLAIGINRSGDIAGFYLDARKDRWHGFVLHAGAFSRIDYPRASYTEAWRINDSGQVAGRYASADGNYHLFLVSSGSFASFDYPEAVETAPAGYSHVGGLNNFGDMVNDYASSAPFQKLSELTGNVHGLVLSGGMFASFDFPAANWTIGYGINDFGNIVGAYEDTNGGFHGHLRTP
jgi:uncharacterized membrane protein